MSYNQGADVTSKEWQKQMAWSSTICVSRAVAQDWLLHTNLIRLIVACLTLASIWRTTSTAIILKWAAFL